MKRIFFAVTPIFLAIFPVYAQFGVPKIKLPSNPLKPATSNVVPSGGALLQSGSLVAYLTVATNQGMKAMDELAAAFPVGKVANYKKLSAQYHAALGQNPTGSIDAKSFTAASDAAEEMSKLKDDWQSYNKEASKDVRKAHSRLTLMLIADAFASTEVPEVMQSTRNEVTSAAADPRQLEKVNQLNAQITFLSAISGQIPRQQKSFQTVQLIAKNIADAEHFQLRPEPSPKALTTSVSLTAEVQKIDTDIPPDAPASGK